MQSRKKVHRLLSGHKLVYLRKKTVSKVNCLIIKNVQALGKLFLVINVV